MAIIFALAGASLPTRCAEPPKAWDEPLLQGALARLGGLHLRQGGLITSLAFSPAGRVLASGGEEGVRLWEAATGRALRHFEGHKDMVYGVAFSADGKQLASASGRMIRLWDAASGKLLRVLPTKSEGALCVAFSPDGRTLAAGCYGGTVCLWNVSTGKEIHRFHKSDDQDIAALAFSPKGEMLAIAAHCHYDGRFLLNAPPIQDSTNTIHLWDVAGWKEMRRWSVSEKGESSLAFSPDGTLLASAGDGVRLWRTANGKEVRRLEEREAASVAFAPDGKSVAALVGDTAKLWSADSGRVLRRFAAGRRAGVLAFSRNGDTLAMASDGTICLWEIASGKKLLPADTPRESVLHVAWSPDGRTLASNGLDGEVRLWDADAAKEIRRLAVSAKTGGRVVSFRDGKILLVEDEDGAIERWQWAAGRKLGPVRGQPKTIAAIAVSVNGRTLATATLEGSVRVLDTDSGRQLQDFTYHLQKKKGKPSPPLVCPTLSADGHILAVATEPSQPVQLWSIATGTPLPSIEGLTGWYQELVFSPDGRTLAGWRENTLRLCETVTGQERWKIGPESRAACTAWSADGSILVTGGWDHLIRFWDLATGKEFHKLAGHRGAVVSLAFSPDGSRLASGSRDSTVLIWDAAALLRSKPKSGRSLTSEEFAERWADLSGRDAARAYRAIQTLARTPRSSLPFLKDRLRPAPAERRIARMVADLDSDDFKVRERAMRELAQEGEAARTALRDVLDARPSLEVRRRAEKLLAKMGEASLPSAMLREVRAVEVLEQIGNTEATGVLRRLAEGAPEARLTREAKAALDRLAKRPPSKVD